MRNGKAPSVVSLRCSSLGASRDLSVLSSWVKSVTRKEFSPLGNFFFFKIMNKKADSWELIESNLFPQKPFPWVYSRLPQLTGVCPQFFIVMKAGGEFWFI